MQRPNEPMLFRGYTELQSYQIVQLPIYCLRSCSLPRLPASVYAANPPPRLNTSTFRFATIGKIAGKPQNTSCWKRQIYDSPYLASSRTRVVLVQSHRPQELLQLLRRRQIPRLRCALRYHRPELLRRRCSSHDGTASALSVPMSFFRQILFLKICVPPIYGFY